MASVRERIVALVKTELETTAGKPTGLTVHRNRARPLEQDDLPAILIYSMDDPAQEVEHDDVVEHMLIVVIELRAKVSQAQVTANVSSEEVIDPLYVWTVQKIMADRTHGSLALTTRENGTTWDLEEKNVVLGHAIVTFDIVYLTAATDPETSKA